LRAPRAQARAFGPPFSRGTPPLPPPPRRRRPASPAPPPPPPTRSHNRIRNQCKDCARDGSGGSQICEHQRERSKCKLCGGASICEHSRERSVCKECRGGSICEHSRRRNQCKDCSTAALLSDFSTLVAGDSPAPTVSTARAAAAARKMAAFALAKAMAPAPSAASFSAAAAAYSASVTLAAVSPWAPSLIPQHEMTWGPWGSTPFDGLPFLGGLPPVPWASGLPALIVGPASAGTVRPEGPLSTMPTMLGRGAGLSEEGVGEGEGAGGL